jgi:chromosome segregation ATPase
LVELADLAVFVTTGILIAITAAVGTRYYRTIRKARFEYERARGIVEEIVRSFNRELKRDAEKLDTIGYKIESNSAGIDTAMKRIGDVEKRVIPLDGHMTAVADGSQRITVALTETGTKVSALSQEHESLKARIANLQEQVDKLTAFPEAKLEPVIPIKRDKAMASLTDTEIAVLEMLAAEGAKTAPEIRERVQLSREHTARLMKKLYEEGYLERETGKIPFKYNVKKEMERFLKKTETPQS